MLKEERVRKIESPGGILGIRYEQIIDETGKPQFLVYLRNLLLDSLYKKDGDWQHFYEVHTNGFDDVDENGKPIKIVPMKKTPWHLMGPLPETKWSKEKIWRETRAFLHEHLDLSDDLLFDVLTAWVFASWIPEKWQSIPYLFFLGPVGSGKTRGLDCLQALCYRALMGPNISGAAIFRVIEKWSVTLLLDESEVYNSESKGDVIGILNSGYRRGQHAIRVVKTKGDKFELGLFNVFGFKALAGTRGQRDTLESRSIIVNMFKAARKIRFIMDLKKAQEIRTQLLLWRLEYLYESSESIESLTEDIPEPLKFADGRFAEKYYPLYMVSNEGQEAIIEYAHKAFQTELDAEESSIEAEFTQTLQKCCDKVENGVMKTKDIREMFNVDRNENEKWKTRTVGSIIKRLGFQRKRAASGDSGFLWDKDVLNRNLKRYRLLDIPLPEPSKLSEHSEKLDWGNVTFESIKFTNCELCDAPSYDAYRAIGIRDKPTFICGRCKKEFEENEMIKETVLKSSMRNRTLIEK